MEKYILNKDGTLSPFERSEEKPIPKTITQRKTSSKQPKTMSAQDTSPPIIKQQKKLVQQKNPNNNAIPPGSKLLWLNL